LGFLGKNPFFEASKMAFLLDFASQTLRPSKNFQKIQFKWGNDFFYPYEEFPHLNRGSPGQNAPFWIKNIGFLA